ncbi:MAG: hypothetical protein NXI31_06780 [bacterium]|nr:hypothetical protein [bacterium]
MSESALKLRRLVEHVLGKGRELPLAMLLEQLVAVRDLRRVARKFDVSPKGFRVDKAPAKVLAAQLAELSDSQQLDEVLGLLRPATDASESKSDVGVDAVAEARKEAEELLRLRESELARLRDELDRARDVSQRAGERETLLLRKLERLELELVAERRDREAAARAQERPVVDQSQQVRALERRVRELEDERDGFVAADEALRRQLAWNRSQLREVEAEVKELEGLIPKSRRRKQKPLPPAPPPEESRRVLVPYFLPSFYKSLDGKDRRAVERAVQAILLFCTEGHSYPGLEVKQLGGQDTWSLRASLDLRVYFRPLPDGDVEVLELADREDQRTTLRRLKEK